MERNNGKLPDKDEHIKWDQIAKEMAPRNTRELTTAWYALY